MQGKKCPRITADKCIFDAAVTNDFDTIKNFCENNGNLSSLDKYGNTLLMSSLLGKCDLKLIEYLVTRINGNIANMHEQNPYHYITQNGIWRNILTNDRNSIIDKLASACIDINKTDKYGDTPLYCELNNGYDNDTIRILLNHGADINHIDSNGNNILMKLIKEHLDKGKNRWLHYPDKVKFLLENGANIYQLNNYSDKPQETPLMVAYDESIINFSRTIGGESFAGDYFNYCSEILRLTDVNYIYENDQTILMLLAQAIKFYSDKKDQYEKFDKSDLTNKNILKEIKQTYRSYLILFNDILKKKPNLNIKNSDGKTIFDIVNDLELPKLKQFLID